MMLKARMNCSYIIVLLCLKLINVNTTYHPNEIVEPLHDKIHKAWLTKATYDLYNIPNVGLRMVQNRSLDLGCVHKDVHCVPDMDNVIDVLFGVSSAEDCQLVCEYHAGDCAMFTWMDQIEEPIPAICFLYSRYDYNM